MNKITLMQSMMIYLIVSGEKGRCEDAGATGRQPERFQRSGRLHQRRFERAFRI